MVLFEAGRVEALSSFLGVLPMPALGAPAAFDPEASAASRISAVSAE